MGDEFEKYREAILKFLIFSFWTKYGKKLERLLTYIREFCWERSAMHVEDSDVGNKTNTQSQFPFFVTV